MVGALTLLPKGAARWGGDGSSARVVDDYAAITGRLRWAKKMGRGTKNAIMQLGRAIKNTASSGLRALSGFILFLATPFLNAFDRAFDAFAEWYHGVLESALDHRARVVAVCLIILGSGVALGWPLDRGLLPAVE